MQYDANVIYCSDARIYGPQRQFRASTAVFELPHFQSPDAAINFVPKILRAKAIRKYFVFIKMLEQWNDYTLISNEKPKHINHNSSTPTEFSQMIANNIHGLAICGLLLLISI